MGEEAFIKFVQGCQQEITRSEPERLFRIDNYVTGQAYSARRRPIVVATGAPREQGCPPWVVLGVKAIEAPGARRRVMSQ